MSIFFDFLKSHQLYSFAAASLIISTFLKFGKKFSRKQMVNSSINLHFLFQLILILMKLRDRMMPGLLCSMPTTTFMINLQVLMVWPLLLHATTRLVTLNFVWIHGKKLRGFYVYLAILWMFLKNLFGLLEGQKTDPSLTCFLAHIIS